MSAEHRITRKLSMQDERDAWDAYASAALTALVTPGSASSDVATLAADYATLLLAERRKAFPPKPGLLSSEPLKL
jgi:uncharacterized membrane protein